MAREGQPPAYQHYASDKLAEWSGLSAEERGALQSLRDYSWVHSAAPRDLAAQARICGVNSRARMARIWSRIESFFSIGLEQNSIVDAELEMQRMATKSYSEKQSNSAKARWAAHAAASAGHMPPPSQGDAAAMPKESSASASSSASAPATENVPRGTNTLPLSAARLNRDELNELWKGKTGLKGLAVPGLQAAADLLESYAREIGRADMMAVAGEAIDVFVRYCDTRSPGYRPQKDGAAFVRNWGHLQPVIEKREPLDVEPAKPSDAPAIVAGLSFKPKGGA